MKKIKLNTEPYIIKSKGYSTIQFLFVYSCKYSEDNQIYMPFLCRMLSNTSKNYNTEKKYTKAKFEKLIVSQKINSVTKNKNTFITCNLVLPDPKKLKSYDIEDGFKFFIDTIYNPNVDNSLFNKKCFNREKNFKQNQIQDTFKEVRAKAYYSFLNIVDDIGVLKNNEYNNYNSFKKLSNKKLYEKYKENILNNDPIIFVYGDVDDDIKTLIKKYIKPKDKKVSFVKDYSNYLIPFKSIKDVEEKSNDNQSILYLGLKVNNMTFDDEIYLSIVKNLLGVTPIDLVFKKLRLEKKLVYSCNVWAELSYGLLCISSSINNTSKDVVIESVKEIIEQLKNPKVLKEYMDKLLECMSYDLIRSKDSKQRKFTKFVDRKSELNYSLDELISKYKKVDINKLIDLINRLKLDTIYFLRGEFNEEK